MRKKCYVQGCPLRAARLFKFPQASKDKIRFLAWLAACGNTTLLDIPPGSLRNRTVCGLHFESKYILARNLSTSAVPTLHLPGQIDVSAYKFGAENENASPTQCMNTESIKCELQVLRNTPENTFADSPCPVINDNSNPSSSDIEHNKRSNEDEPCVKRRMRADASPVEKHGKQQNLCNGRHSTCSIIRLCSKVGILRLMHKTVAMKLKRHSSSKQAHELKLLKRLLRRGLRIRNAAGSKKRCPPSKNT